MITMDVKMKKSIGKMNSSNLLFPNYRVDSFLDLLLSIILMKFYSIIYNKSNLKTTLVWQSKETFPAGLSNRFLTYQLN